jgi:hypothetical protein
MIPRKSKSALNLFSFVEMSRAGLDKFNLFDISTGDYNGK